MSRAGFLAGVIHLHSCHSPDSITSLGSIRSAAEREHLDFVMLTDHDTISGAVALRKQIADSGLELVVPIAAEYLTDAGDVIAAFIEEGVRARDFEGFVREVHDQGGLVLLPHPYVGHENVDFLASKVDAIEVVNGRVSDADNDRARQLAQKWNKPFYFGSDAHLASNITNVVVSIEDKGDLATSLLNGKIDLIKYLPVGRRDVVISRLIKAIKMRDSRAILNALRRRVCRLVGKQ